VLLPPTQNLVQIASANPDFSILVQAVVKAGLVDVLSKPGAYTVFAPTNAAFVSLLAERGFPSLDAIDPITLKNVLLYHVVSGRVYSSDLKTGPVTSLGGTFNVDLGTLTITDSKGRKSGLIADKLNIQATNGVIHVINKVMLP
jgi:transforming growth factor-beta-induced protein